MPRKTTIKMVEEEVEDYDEPKVKAPLYRGKKR